MKPLFKPKYSKADFQFIITSASSSSMSFVFQMLASKNRSYNRYRKKRGDDNQRRGIGDMKITSDDFAVVIENHFDANKDQNNAQGIFEIIKNIHDSPKGKIKRPKSENGKDVGSINDKGIR